MTDTPPVKPTPLERARDAIRYMEGHVPPDVLADTAVAAALSEEEEMVQRFEQGGFTSNQARHAVYLARLYLLGGES